MVRPFLEMTPSKKSPPNRRSSLERGMRPIGVVVLLTQVNDWHAPIFIQNDRARK